MLLPVSMYRVQSVGIADEPPVCFQFAGGCHSAGRTLQATATGSLFMQAGVLKSWQGSSMLPCIAGCGHETDLT